jgi:glycyl-tRNA synthetase beta chain
MKELLIECYSEEIPSACQQLAAQAFVDIFSSFLGKHCATFQSIKGYFGPCRITLHINGLKLNASDELVRGPRSDAESGTLESFCQKHQASLSDLTLQDQGDNKYYYLSKKNHDTLESLLMNNIPKLLASYNWPKSMCWGNYDIKWIRPLKNILCLLQGKILPIRYGHLQGNNITFGHKFFNNEPLVIDSFKEYEKKLRTNNVILDQDERKAIIHDQLQEICLKDNLELNSDNDLLNELVGLVEYPVVISSDIPQEFIELPPELLICCLKNHQKYFTCRAGDKIANKFLFVSNWPIKDFSKIIQGNQRVLQARLSDAAHFFYQDLNDDFQSKLQDLEKIVFHSKLGTMLAKVLRICKICQYLYPDNRELHLAAKLSKCDLATSVVQEFPELQGVISRYYAFRYCSNKNVAEAIAQHYAPVGLMDKVPSDMAAILSLVDKLDSLVGLFLAQEKATSSKDPYGFRRNAIGVLRIILEHKLSINLEKLIAYSIKLYGQIIQPQANSFQAIKNFILDRLKNLLNKTYSIKIINCILQDDLSLLNDLEANLEKLTSFCQTSDWEAIIAAYRRITGVLHKNTRNTDDAQVNKELFTTKYEHNLFDTANQINFKNTDIIQNIVRLEILIKPIDEFFDNVLVNDKEYTVAQNRQNLICYILGVFDRVLSFKELL